MNFGSMMKVGFLMLCYGIWKIYGFGESLVIEIDFVMWVF